MKKILKGIIGFLLGREPQKVEETARAALKAIKETRENIRLNNELTQGGHQHGPEETSR